MNPLKKLTIVAAAAIPAVAMFAGVASAGVENHVLNGTFNVNAKAWSAGPGAAVQKHDGYPMGVVTNEKFSATASTVTVVQCVNLHSGLDAQFEGRVFIPANQERSGSAGFVVTMFSGEKCGGLEVGEASLPKFSYETQEWFTHAFNLPMGNAPESALVTIAVTKSKMPAKPGADFMAFVDDIKVTQFVLEVAEEDDDCLCAEEIGEEPSGDGPVEPERPDPEVPVLPDTREEAEEAIPPVRQPEEPAQPADEPTSDEPAPEAEEPSHPAEEPAAPAADEPATQDNNDAPAGTDGTGSNEPAPAAPATGSAEPQSDDSSDEPAEAETSEQYELEAEQEDDARELGRGQADTPAAPATGFTIAETKDMVGADELGLFGGVLAFFGLMLAAIAIKRERSNS